MPSVDNTPDISALMRAYHGEQTSRDELTDTHEGSNLDIWGGIAAVLLTREARRARDIFRANYFDQASGEDLNEILTERFHDGRILDAPGTGTALLKRASAAAGAGTIWQGTRIEVAVLNGATRTYLVSADTTVAATTTVIWIPVTSVETGLDAAITVTAASPLLRFADPLWDNTFEIQNLQCAAGTIGETEEQAKSRIRQARQDSRVGYAKRVVQGLKDAGATQVVLFGSDYLDTPPGETEPVIGELSSGYGDVGLNRIFVADDSFTSSHLLLCKCRKALTSVAVLGTSIQLWGMVPTAVSCTVTAQLWDDPGAFDQDSVRAEIRNAIGNYFKTGSNAYYFRYVALQGAVMRDCRSVQTLSFSGGPSEPNLLTFLNTSLLPHYFAGNLTIVLTGPS